MRGAKLRAALYCLLAALLGLWLLLACQSSDADDDEEKAKFDTPTKAVVTPDPVDGQAIYVFVLNAYTGTVSVIQADDDQEVIWGKGDKGEDEVLGVGDFPKDLDIAPDGLTVYVTDATDANLYAIDVTDWSVKSFEIGFSGGRPRVDRSGELVWLIDQRGSRLVLWDARTAAIAGELELDDAPAGLALAPDGDTAYVTTAGGELLQIDTGALSVSASWPLVGTPGEVLVSRDGSEIYALSAAPPRLFVLDAAAAELRTVDLLGIPKNLGSSPAGDLVYITNSDGYLYVYDVGKGRPCGASATLPAFYDRGPASNPTISEVEVEDCVTYSAVWKVIFDQAEQEWVVRSEEYDEDDEEYDDPEDESGRAEEGRRYVSDAGEVTFTIESGERWTSDKDRFVFETDAGIEPIIVGRLPDAVVTTPIPEDPEYHYIYVVNTGTHNVSILTSAAWDYDETIN